MGFSGDACTVAAQDGGDQNVCMTSYDVGLGTVGDEKKQKGQLTVATASSDNMKGRYVSLTLAACPPAVAQSDKVLCWSRCC